MTLKVNVRPIPVIIIKLLIQNSFYHAQLAAFGRELDMNKMM